MNPRILVLIGTPLPDTLTHALAGAYARSAGASGAEVRVIDLAHDPVPEHPRTRNELRMPRTDADVPLDPQVASYIEDVRWADHIAVFYPQWWGTYPAAMKAFIDRVLLSGFAFRYRPAGKLWDRLLTGRTARIVMTMDSPRAWNAFVYRGAAETSLTRAILGYCGIRTRGVTRFAEVRHRTDDTRRGWVDQAARLGGLDGVAAVSADRRHARLGSSTGQGAGENAARTPVTTPERA
ncbi:MAG: NAD(P)H dehydrogenase [Microbacterium sp.]|uniref:NAD(P)H-dependent oxidoreductase n=1 Tax=Microbacterium sp. TaxID=51671 RepID=UPI000DB6C634|nr:NAD(P)H-dependent oxidoreductase [Microbacterium sp.]PZU40692.1 MAG: NAD(P)H dehydrogenase [Microbacterium sp.]